MFADTLEIKILLTVDKKTIAIPGGNVKSLKLDLQPYGFTSILTFVVSGRKKEKDILFPFFINRDLMKVRVALKPRWQEDKVEPLVVQGLVTAKDILEEYVSEEVRVEGDPVLYRHYRIVFADPARVLWRQYFPCDLMTNKSVKDLLEAHRGSTVSLKYDWDVLNRKYPINTLPLGVEEKEASFYDFVVWFASQNNGVFTYDAYKNQYTLSASKKDIGRPILPKPMEVEDLHIEFPQTSRHQVKVLNAYSEKPERQEITQDQAVDGVLHEHLVRFPIAGDFKEYASLEKKKLKTRQHEIRLTFRRFPLAMYRPGCLVNFDGPGWSEKLYLRGKVYRVRTMAFEASAVESEITGDHYEDYGRYNISLQSLLELRTEKWVDLPPHRSPVFPIYVEGEIVSEQGGKEAETYQIYQDKKSSLDQYRVTIPLWNKQQVVAPFEPNFFTGHFYFPDYKKARVLVALDFHSARIERFLNWRGGARLPMDSQGNHMLLGKSAKSQTSLKHVYVDDKPVLEMKRTSGKDSEMIKMIEGSLILETKEE